MFSRNYEFKVRIIRKKVLKFEFKVRILKNKSLNSEKQSHNTNNFFSPHVTLILSHTKETTCKVNAHADLSLEQLG